MCSFIEGYDLKNFNSHQIQNDKLEAITDFNIGDIRRTAR